MKKIKYIITLVVMIFIYNSSIYAISYGGCSYSDISRLKSLVSNINLSYDYYVNNNRAYFNITLSNIVPGIYFIDSNSGKTYSYIDSNNGEIIVRDIRNIKGIFKFYSSLDGCYGFKLSDKYYTLPSYNYYYTDPLCDENREFSLCQKWINVNYSRSEFEKLIKEYNNNQELEQEDKQELVIYEKNFIDEIINFYVKYYYIILPSIIIFCIITMIISKRKNRFDL